MHATATQNAHFVDCTWCNIATLLIMVNIYRFLKILTLAYIWIIFISHKSVK